MGVVSEFRQFISRGNVIDLAVGVIIGASFGKIVTVFVDGIIMPPIGLALGKVDFAELKIVLAPKVGETAEVAITYGAFINTIIQFLIVAVAVFLLVKLVNAARRKEAEGPAPSTPPAPTPSEELLTEIRDLLAAQKAAPPVARVVPVKAEAAPVKAVVRKPAVKKPAAPKKA